MLNLDKKRQTLKKLRDKGKSNFLLFIPCFIAYFFVSAYYFFALHLDMLLSDKEGRFLGIEKHGKANKYAASAHSSHSSHSAARGETSAKRAARGDDYTPGGSRVKAGARLVSAFLMVCFVFTFLPMVGWVDFGLNLSVAAVEYDSKEYSPTRDVVEDNADRLFDTYYYTLDEVPDLKTVSLNSNETGYGNGSVVIGVTYSDTGTVYYDGIDVTISNAETGALIGTDTFNSRDTERTIPVSDKTSMLAIRLVPFYFVPEYRYKTHEMVEVITTDSNGVETKTNERRPLAVPYMERVSGKSFKISSSSVLNVPQGQANTRVGPVTGPVTASYDKENNEVTLTWRAVDSSGYIIYRTPENSTAEKIPYDYIKAGATPPTYTDTGLDPTTKYTYSVKAYVGVTNKYKNQGFSGSTAEEKYFVLSDTFSSESNPIVTYIEKPTGGSYTPTTSGNRISWLEVESIRVSPDPAGYIVYRLTDADLARAGIDIVGGGNTTADITLAKIKQTGVSPLFDPANTGNANYPYRQTQYVDGTRDPAVKYYYAVVSYRNVAGTTPPINESEPLIIPTTDVDLPDPPTGVVTYPDNDENAAWISWNSVAEATSYTVYYEEVIVDLEGNETFSTPRTVSINSSPYKLPGLRAGTKYRFRIAAVNSERVEGEKSDPAFTTVGYYTPNQSRKPTISNLTSEQGQITVEWTPVSTPDYADSYNVYRSQYNENTGWSGYSQIATGVIGTSYPDETVADRIDYRYKVGAVKEVSADGSTTSTVEIESPQSESITAGVSVPKPINGRVEVSANHTANITWTAGQKGINDVDVGGYLVFIRNRAGNDVLNSPYETSTTSISIPIPGETADYNVYVYAYQSGKRNVRSDELHAGEIFFEPLVLLPPTDLQAKAAVNSIALSWNASPSTGVDGYAVYAGRTNGTLTQIGTTTTNSYTHNNLGVGETWYYFVKSYRNKANGDPEQSPRSTDIASATTGTGGTEGVVFPPTDFRGTVKDNTVDLTWTASRGSADGYYLYTKAGTTVSSTDYTKRYNTTKTTYLHDEPVSGDNSYVLVAYKYNTASGQYLYSEPTEIVTKKVGALPEDPDTGTGTRLAAPLDFLVTTTDGEAKLTWKAVDGAYGYRVHAAGPTGALVFDRSAVDFTHSSLINGEKWTYYVTAITPSGTGVTEGVPTQSYSVVIGETLNRPVDFVFTAGNRQIDLDWSDVTGAEGYVVYLNDQTLRQYVPIAYVTESNYSATGLTNDREYTFGLAAFKTINGEVHLSPRAIPITAKPTTGTPTDLDRKIAIKGTAPHGMDRSDLMAAYANHGAFDGDVDIYIQTIDSSTIAIQNALSGYAGGLSSFMIYPFDITLYQAGTYIEPVLNPGYTVTVTLPLPDELVRYREYIQVMHLDSNGILENLGSSLAEIEDTWCIQFEVLQFSPFAFVIYKDAIVEAGSGTGSFGVFAANAFGQIVNFPQAMVPFGMRLKRGRRRVYRIVRIGRKR